MDGAAHTSGGVGCYFCLRVWWSIVPYRDILMDKLQQIILYKGSVLKMFPGMTISVSCLKFDSYKMPLVDFAH